MKTGRLALGAALKPARQVLQGWPMPDFIPETNLWKQEVQRFLKALKDENQYSGG